jgi:uracil DNA glycosylase
MITSPNHVLTASHPSPYSADKLRPAFLSSVTSVFSVFGFLPDLTIRHVSVFVA